MPHRRLDRNAHGEYSRFAPHGEAKRRFLVKVTRETKQTKFRIPEEVLTYLKEQAGKNFRSVNAELMARLVRTMEQDSAGGSNA